MRKYLFGIVYALLLAAFTAYVTLDSFVLVRVYQDAATAPSDQTDGIHPTDTPAAITENSYEDANIRVNLTQSREHETDVYIADVRVTSPALLKTALARDAYGRNVTDTVSAMAADSGAILAINGDYYGSRERGYVVRSGVIYRESASGNEALAIMADGSFRVVQEGQVSTAELVADGAAQVLSFGPALVTDGEISVTARDEVGRAMTSNPRTAIGIIEPGHYLFVVSDGRTRTSQGLTLLELAEFMQGLGASTAYNLYHGELVVKRFTNFSKKHDDAAKHHRSAGYQWHRKGHLANAGWPRVLCCL